MPNKDISPALCADLERAASGAELLVRPRPSRYEAGRVLDLGITTVHPAVEGRATLRLEKSLGGGFAGQVYRCRLERLDLPGGAEITGLSVGGRYAVKIIVPPTAFSCRFRNALYWLAFQGPFSAQVNRAACRAGLLWQKLTRRAGRVAFGREDAVKDAYASFWDPELGAYGEVTEWVEGRTWRLETDDALWRRWSWRPVRSENSSRGRNPTNRTYPTMRGSRFSQASYWRCSSSTCGRPGRSGSPASPPAPARGLTRWPENSGSSRSAEPATKPGQTDG